MNTKNKIFWISYIYLLALVLIRLIPIIAPGSRTWGFNHLIFLPDIYSYCFFFIASIALIIPFIRYTEKAGEKLSEWFSDRFLESRFKYLYRFLFIAVMTTLFAIFTASTHFLGDGYTVIKNLTSETGILVKWSEVGVIRLMWNIRELLGPPNEEISRLAFQIVSIASGAISIYFMFLISRTISENNIKRFIVFVAAFFSGMLLLFFGYTEYYPIIWVFMTGFIYFSLKFLKSGKQLIIAWLFLIVGIVLHLQMAVFVPAAVYMTFSKGNGLILYGRFKKLIWGAAGLVIISCLTLLIYKYTTNLYIEDIFLPLLNGKPVYPEYAILSVPHLLDILNEFILVSPLLFLLILIGGRNIKSIFENKSAIFLGLSAIGFLLFLFVIDPKLAFPRDWDLFSMSGFSLNILLVLMINGSRIKSINKLLPALMIIMSITILPFLLTNLNEESSEKYMEYQINIDQSKSLSTAVNLMNYYKKNGNTEKYDSLQLEFNRNNSQHNILFEALAAIVRGDMKSAKSYMQDIKPDRFNGDYHRLLSLISLSDGQYNKALGHINNAIQLRRHASFYYYTRARIYLMLEKYEIAREDLYEACRLNSKFSNALNALAYIYDLNRQYDSCNYYAKETLAIDPTSIQSYFWMTKSYAFMNKIDSAKIFLKKYTQFVKNDSTLKSNLELLDSLIINKGR